MRGKLKQREGAITIEASIVVTLFMFLILTIYSFFIVFEAQGKISSTLIRTAQSLSMDPYVTQRINSSIWDADSVNAGVATIVLNIKTKNDSFTSTSKWYQDGNLDEVVQSRFLAFLSEGDREEADQYLAQLRINDGLDGLDFSESTVDENGDLNLVVTYRQNYFFDYPLFHLQPIEMRQTAKAHLWK